MAIQLALAADQNNIGVAFPQAYAVIVNTSTDGPLLQYFVQVFADEAAYTNNAQPVRVNNFFMTVEDYQTLVTQNGGDLKAALYANLITQPIYDTGTIVP